MKKLLRGLLCVWLFALSALAMAEKPPVLVGADLEISDATSTADDAILLGAQTAIDEINASGGVLGGRPLKLFKTDNRAIPARARENALVMAGTPDLVAMLVGKFSAVAMEQLDVVNGKGLIMLDPWAAADPIVNNGASPNYVFRLSLTDSWAIAALLEQARKRGLYRLGVLIPSNAWGRSCLKAIDNELVRHRGAVVSVQSYYWGGEKSLARHYQAMLDAGAEAVIMIANEADGALFVRDVAARNKEDRLPILSHWGIISGDFIRLSAEALDKVDLVTLTTRAVLPPRNAKARRLQQVGMAYFKVDRPGKILSQAGMVHAYELTHLLAMAIERAGSTDRAAIRDALEHLGPYDGAIKRYAPPFTPGRHEALSASDVVLARFGSDGSLVPINR